jgi:UDP:flavonoid glycosyltransferase YjiC (YdhE family)
VQTFVLPRTEEQREYAKGLAIPSVIVPFYGDQPFWARCLNRQGVAPPAVERKTMTADILASALAATQHPTMIQKAMALAGAVRTEDGIGEDVLYLRECDLARR